MATPCLVPSSVFNSTLLTHESTQWLPPRLVSQLFPLPTSSDPVSSAIDSLHQQISAVQEVPEGECERRGVRLSIKEGGFGSTLNALLKPMIHAILRHRVPLGAQQGEPTGSRAFHLHYNQFRAQPLDLFKNKSKCESESLECFLLPLSNCSEERRLRLPAKMLGGRFLEVAPSHVLREGAPPSAQPLIQTMESAGHFNAMTVLLTRLVRPSDAVRAEVARVKQSLGWPDLAHRATPHRLRPLMIGLHFRAGDSCAREALGRHNRTCEPLSAFMPAVRDVERAYGAGRQVYVYLSTDDQAAAAEAREMSRAAELAMGERLGSAGGGPSRLLLEQAGGQGKSHGINSRGTLGGARISRAIWLIRPDEEVRRTWRREKLRRGRVGDILQIEVVLRQRLSDGYDDAMDVMVDLELLSECDALIGKFSSNIDRIAYSMMAVKRGEALAQRIASHHAAGLPAKGVGEQAAPPKLCLPPYVSLDHPWCADFGVRTPVRRPQPPPYPGASSPGRNGEPPLIGGFQC